MKIIRTLLIMLLSVALTLYLLCCLIGNSWNPKVSVDSLLAASGNKSEQVVKAASYSSDLAGKLPEGFSTNDGYVYYKDGEVSMEEALVKLGFTQSGRTEWTTPEGFTAEIASVTYSAGGKMIHYVTTGKGSEVDVAPAGTADETPTEIPTEAETAAPAEIPTEAPAETEADEALENEEDAENAGETQAEENADAEENAE